MSSIVDIETETLNLIFELLKSDFDILKMAISRNWVSGVKHYKKRLNASFEKLHGVEKMIDSVKSTYNKDIEQFKTEPGVPTSSGAADDDDNIRKIQQQLKSIKKSMESKLKELKSIHWEREMRMAGFTDFDRDGEFHVDSIRRDRDGTLQISNID